MPSTAAATNRQPNNRNQPTPAGRGAGRSNVARVWRLSTSEAAVQYAGHGATTILSLALLNPGADGGGGWEGEGGGGGGGGRLVGEEGEGDCGGGRQPLVASLDAAGNIHVWGAATGESSAG